MLQWWKRRSKGRRMLIAFTVGLLALGITAAAAIGIAVAPPRVPPAYTESRPQPVEAGLVSHTETALIALPRKEFLTWINQPELELDDLLETDGGMAAVTGTQAVWGEEPPQGEREGYRRRVDFDNGHHLAEEILIDTDDRYRYMIWGFTDHRRFAVEYGIAEFQFEDLGDQTQVTWTYSLRPRGALVRPFVSRFVEGDLAAMMRATLDGMKTGAEADAAG